MLKVPSRAALQAIAGDRPTAPKAIEKKAPDPMAEVKQALIDLSSVVAQGAAMSAQAQQGMADAIKSMTAKPVPEQKNIRLKATVQRDRDGKMQTVIITSMKE
jgi:hypothetical protein